MASEDTGALYCTGCAAASREQCNPLSVDEELILQRYPDLGYCDGAGCEAPAAPPAGAVPASENDPFSNTRTED